MLSYGFPPIVCSGAKVLILGSLPGRLSLQRSEYYANSQNAFWRIVAAHQRGLPEDYAQRVARLAECGIALWDVLAAATRSGSLDADIADDAIPNNFRAFFHAYPGIRLIAFNGATAARLYLRNVVPALTEHQRATEHVVLPSSSAANAGARLAEKVERWSIVWKRCRE